MKKNIFSVIITALTAINVILTAIMFFVMLPTFQKTNNLITQVASVLDIELDGGKSAKGNQNYSMGDLESLPTTFDSEQTINLKKGSDGDDHFAKLSGYTVSVNTKADDYKDVKEAVTNNQSQVTDIVRSVIRSHTADDISEDVIDKEILDKMQKEFDTKCVVKVVLSNFVFQ